MRIKNYLILPFLSVFSTAVFAAPIQIATTPSETSGPFRHNAFHEASSNGGQSGAILGWFDLSAGGGSWDPDNGVFIINIDIFSDGALTTSIGTAVGIGDLTATEFNGFNGGLIGTINWDFDATAEGNGLADVTTSFLDINYVTSDAGYTANSTTGNYSSMTLWGADGSYDVNSGIFDVNTTSMGVDLVVTFVPVPAAIWLFGSGLIGLITIARRRT